MPIAIRQYPLALILNRSTSMTIYTPIPPTYLYIKQHSITGLKYFGKTTQDPYKYKGSGLYWTNHIKKYGKEHIVTLWVSDPYHDTSISELAIQLSKENNIVESKEWANLKLENGLDGGSISNTESIETRTKRSNSLKGKNLSNERKNKISISLTGKTQSIETRTKRSISQKGIIKGPQKTIECPYCKKIASGSNIHRWHNDNCKFKL